MSSKHYLDANTAISHSFSIEDEALRVKQIEASYSFSLNEKEDSVTAVAPHVIVNTSDPVSAVGMREYCLYTRSFATIEVSPMSDGDIWYEINSTPKQINSICATRIRVTSDDNFQLVMRG